MASYRKQHFFVHVNDQPTCGYCRGAQDDPVHIFFMPEVIDEVEAAFNDAQKILLSHLVPLKIHPRRGQ